MKSTGNGGINLLGGDFIVNSSDSSAVQQTGGSTMSTDQNMFINGGYSGGNIQAQNIFTGQLPEPDPFAGLKTPTPINKNGVANGAATVTKVSNGIQVGSGSNKKMYDVYVITPGIITPGLGDYPNSGNFAGNNNVIIFNGAGVTNPIFQFGTGTSNSGAVDFKDTGVAYIGMASGATYGSQTTTATAGMMMYMQNGQMMFSGGDTTYTAPNGTVYDPYGIFGPGGYAGTNLPVLKGHASGDYKNMLFWQPASNTSQVKVTGQASYDFQGTFYAPTASLSIQGQGGVINKAGTQYVVNDITVNGNGNLEVNYGGGVKASAPVLRLVE